MAGIRGRNSNSCQMYSLHPNGKKFQILERQNQNSRNQSIHLWGYIVNWLYRFRCVFHRELRPLVTVSMRSQSDLSARRKQLLLRAEDNPRPLLTQMMWPFI